jgi:hypothetical protein
MFIDRGKRARWTMDKLTAEEAVRLVEIIKDRCARDIGFDDFSDELLRVFDDLPGFEIVSIEDRLSSVASMWTAFEGSLRKDAIENQPIAAVMENKQHE